MAKQIKVREDNYFAVQGWMVTELKLKGNALMLYAIIYGFSQTTNTAFTGSVDYLCEWLGGVSRPTVINTLDNLVKQELLTKSSLRLQKWLKNGCNAFNNKRPVSQPLSFWREQDILLYLLKYDKKYAEVYGKIIGRYKDLEFSTSRLKKIMEKAPKTWEDRIELATTGAERTGCMFCGFGCHLEKSPNRFQRMKETHPKQYEYCLRPVEQGGLGMAEVLDYIGVDYK